MQYANGVTVNFVIEPGKGPMGGAVFVCEKGKLEINRNKFSSNPPEIAAELNKKVDVAEEERKWSDELALWQARWHMQDWLDCIRIAQAARRRRRDRPSLGQRLPSGEHHPRRGPAVALGRPARAIRRRRGGQQFVGSAAPPGLRIADRLIAPAGESRQDLLSEIGQGPLAEVASARSFRGSARG